MSYCRWSSDDFRCDVYCYESTEGIQIWVASRRYSKPGRVDLQPIGLPCDGMDFEEETHLKAAERLETLREMGYRVPQYAIDALRADHLLAPHKHE